MFLDSDQIWIVGNIAPLHHFHRIHAQVLHRPAPLLAIFSNTLHPNLPTTIIDWKHVQDTEPDFLKTLDPDSIAHCNDLTVYKTLTSRLAFLFLRLSAINSSVNTTPTSSTSPIPKSSPRWHATTFGPP